MSRIFGSGKDKNMRKKPVRPLLTPARQELLAIRLDLSFLDVMDMPSEVVDYLLAEYRCKQT
jgi:hypothetical protein